METSFTLIKTFLPYVISGIIGGTIAWNIQGARVDSAKLETQQCEANHNDYVNQQTTQRLEYEAEAERRSREASTKYAAAEAELRENVQNFDVYRRCVAAGKCGARVQYSVSSCKPTNGIQTTFGTHAAGSDSVPVTGEPTTKGPQDSVLADCAVATLRVNYLQGLIEKQSGY